MHARPPGWLAVWWCRYIAPEILNREMYGKVRSLGHTHASNHPSIHRSSRQLTWRCVDAW